MDEAAPATGTRHNGQGPPKSSVPDVPGVLVSDDHAHALKTKVARICGLNHLKFPGAQPVSFTRQTVQMLKEEDFWVCEKSDGQRVLLLIVFNKNQGQQEVYLIDRKNNYRLQHMALFFPHNEIPIKPETLRSLDMAQLGDFGVRKDTLLDGELVNDVAPDGSIRMRLLLFDCIVLDGVSLRSRPLDKRYARLSQMLFPPFMHFMRTHPQAAKDAPYELKVKKMDLAYGISSVLHHRIPNLEHGNDGLIFTCIHSGYVAGTDHKIIKWKPPSENTIDFKLRLRFPPDYSIDARGNVPNLKAKPFFQLDEFMGDRGRSSTDDGYAYYDWLYVSDEEWEAMKENGEQFDDRIVECSWDPHGGPVDPSNPDVPPGPAWRLHRIRDDKHDGNHTSIVQKIIGSIQDGVEEDQLLQEEEEIRRAWKSAQRLELRNNPDGIAGSSVANTRNGQSSHALSSNISSTTQRRGPPPPMRGTPPDWLKRR